MVDLEILGQTEKLEILDLMVFLVVQEILDHLAPPDLEDSLESL